MKRLIVTADDFGLSIPVNEAVERAHLQGILTSASLMVGSPACADAVDRARRLPKLSVGLHLVLVEARPVLPPDRIPDLVDGRGMFRADMARSGAAMFFLPKVRRQLADEIEAQFAAYASTGLPLDHVDAHKHFHLHPTIAGTLIAVGRRHGMRAVRVPFEPQAIVRRIDPAAPRLIPAITAPFTRMLGARMRRAGLTVPDQVFGLAWSGAMTADRLAALLDRLPSGLTEIYTHPATSNAFAGSAPGYRYTDELAALTAPAVLAAATASGARSGAGFRTSEDGMPVIDGWGGDIDVAVVGAGSAGVAAARRVLALRPDLSVLLLEAGHRIGGRACTILPSALGVPVDVGCGWLHGARTNAWTHIADEVGFVVDHAPAPWDGGGRKLGLPPDDRADCDAAMERFFARAEAWDETAPDAPLSALLEPDNRWNALLGAIGTYINGAELDRASIRDYQNYDPGPGPDWRVRDGYGRLVESYAAPVPVVFGAAVSRIHHGGATGVRLETSRGTLLARAVVVTVSTDVLAAEALRFDPPLPAKAEAASNLPLGLADKLFLSLAEPEDFSANGHLLGSAHRTGTGAYHIRPFGRPVVECYFAGQLAHDLERDGQAAALAFAADELAGHFGADIRGRLGFGAIAAWARDPLFRGSYSYAKPGFADARAVLAAPVEGGLFFAGEACPPHRFSTAHGAYESGVTAAEQVMASLRQV